MIRLFILSLVANVAAFQPTLPRRLAPPQTADSFKCTQPAPEQDPLLREAIENRYTVRSVEFVGNEHTRDYRLRRRIFLQEGDVFNRENLTKSIRSVSKLKNIYPVRLSDVIVRLERPDKLIDFAFCFRERHPRRPKRAS